MIVTFRHYPWGSSIKQLYEEIMHIRSVIHEKKEKWILLKGDGMVTEWSLNGHWNVPAIQSTERWLKGDWMAPFSFHGMVAFRLVFFREENIIVPNVFFSIDISNQRQNDKSYVSYTSDSTLTPMTIMITRVIQHQNTH